jgi:spore germination protein KC
MNGQIVPQVKGTAVFKGDKLIGFLNEDETKALLFIKNNIKGGLLIEEGVTNSQPVALEIFRNKSSIKPEIHNDEMTMRVKIETNVAIDEIQGCQNLIDEIGLKQLQIKSEKNLKVKIQQLIDKMQEQGVDIFGFGAKVKQHQPETWDEVKNDWPEHFRKLPVNVSVKIQIRNSAMLSKPFKAGD